MNRFLFFVVYSFCISGLAQSNSLPSVIRAKNTLYDLSKTGVSPNNILYGIPIESGILVGDFFIDKKWNRTTILMYEKERLLEGYLTRFDIKSSNLEIKLNDGVKVLQGRRIKSLVWIDSLTNAPRYFLNAKDYSLNNIELNGLLEVLIDGSYPLFKRVTTSVKKATYNVALDVGSKDEKIIKKEAYYFSEANKLIEVKRKKDLLEYFKSRSGDLELFISNNKLSVSKENDLLTIFRYINL